MRYHALATDYDGTLAHNGRVDEATLDALRQLRESGRQLILVTGRELDDLEKNFAHFDLFDRIVAENGAVLFRPATREIKVLVDPPPPAFVEALRKRGVAPLSVGHVIVATWEPHQTAVLDVIRALGLELHVIFNKGAVMVLPGGVNKATGLMAALDELSLSPHNVIGIGDAENDHAFLIRCECGVAVANALPALRQTADLVTQRDHGAGVAELIAMLVHDDLASVAPRLTRHRIHLGERDGGGAEDLDPSGRDFLVCGTSGSGKSTLTTGLLERLADHNYQFAIIDPEGDYSNLEFAVVLGSPQRAPLPEEVFDLLAAPGRNAVVNLLGIPLEDRPRYFQSLLPGLVELRGRTARPHWLVIDEAHHLLPTSLSPESLTLLAQLRGLLLITVHPESVAPGVLKQIDVVLAIGEHPAKTLAAFCKVVQKQPPEAPNVPRLATGDALLWHCEAREALLVHTERPRGERRRHSRKYAEGNLGADRSFVFRGPERALNLKAPNLVQFLHLADGVDDATWQHHLDAGDYSRWFRDLVKDEELAGEAAEVEANHGLSPQESRAAVRKAIESRYTLPADKPSGSV
jgi:hydroxymethylpyrimidine pyrophosphatase-like HAD family hydrolase